MSNRKRNYIWLLIALIAGLLIGWLVVGWLVAPVEWTNAEFQDLKPEAQQELVTTVAEAYALTQDSQRAVARLSALGSQEDVARVASEAILAAEAAGDLGASDRIRALAAATGLALTVPERPAAESTPAPEQDASGGGGAPWNVLGLLLIGGGVALAAWLLLRRRAAPEEEYFEEDAAPAAAPKAVAAGTRGAAPTEAPVVTEPAGQRFRAQFNQGDVTFDESFDIEGPDGTYLGECGVTISEMVDGDPERATALEVWLFDKSDIRTVTKVLMSDYAYGNSALRDKLSSRGDAVLLGPGLGFVLDAQTLRLAGKVAEMEYDQSSAPPSSTIRRMTVDLRVIQQAGS